MIIREKEERNRKVTEFKDIRGHIWRVRTEPVFEDRKLLYFETVLFLRMDFRSKVKDSAKSSTKQQAYRRHDGFVARLQRHEAEDCKHFSR